MKIIKTEAGLTEYIQQNIARYYRSKTLIPFIGAGFTKGCKSRKGKVPDGSQCSDQMKSMIISQLADDDTAKVETAKLTDFDIIANYFYRLVPTDDIQDFISENFTSVTLLDNQKEFINFEWPSIYTLNIDDAIESSTWRQIVLPNQKINKKYLNKPVFKLHGDARDELTYIRDRDGIIFSRKQYLQSLTENKDLLLIFLEDYATYNFFFIGCSLVNELDLEFVLANNNTSSPTKTDKIYVTSNEPSKLTRIRLETFGINVCLVVSDYVKFYQAVAEALSLNEVDEQDIFSQYLVKTLDENNKPEFNKGVICGEEEIRIINNKLTVPSFFAHRELTRSLIDLLVKENIIFVIGRRVSGKTFFLYDIVKTLKTEKIYLIPSKVSIDSILIDKIDELNNCIIMFDTDSIIPSDIEDIYYRITNFKKHNIRFLFMINSSDRLMLSVPYTRALDSEILELNNTFTQQELSGINHELSRLGLARLKTNSNILTNIVNHQGIYRRLDTQLNKIPRELDERSLQIFILGAVFDKVYSSLYRALKIDYDILKFTLEYSNKSLEFEFGMDDIERGQHANYKVVTNSKSFIFSLLGKYIFQNQANMTASANAVVAIVARLRFYESFRNYWKSLISFDNLNQIFYHSKKGGAIRLIFLIYQQLETLLFEDSHYWLQRGKSIYYLSRNNSNHLEKAIEYSKKPYYDSAPNTRIKSTSSFQIAMIYNRIAAIQNFSNTDIVNEAVDWYSISLKETNHNLKIVNNFLEEARQKKFRSDFYNLCHYIMDNPRSTDKQKRSFLLSKLLNKGVSSA